MRHQRRWADGIAVTGNKSADNDNDNGKIFKRKRTHAASGEIVQGLTVVIPTGGVCPWIGHGWATETWSTIAARKKEIRGQQ